VWQPEHGMRLIGEDGKPGVRTRAQLVRVDPLPGRGTVKWHVLIDTDPQVVFPFACDEDLVRSSWRPEHSEERTEPSSFASRIDYLSDRLLTLATHDPGVAHALEHLSRDLQDLKRLPVARPWHERVALNKAQIKALVNWRMVPPGNRGILVKVLREDAAKGYEEAIAGAVEPQKAAAALLEALGEIGKQDEPVVTKSYRVNMGSFRKACRRAAEGEDFELRDEDKS